MAARIFNNQVLTTSFVASKVFILGAEHVTLDFEAVITTGSTIVEYFIEYTVENPLDAAVRFFREVAEENAGNGVVAMPIVIRSLKLNGAANNLLTVGTHRTSHQFIRHHKMVRIQARLLAGGGAARLTVDEPFATIPQLTG